MKILITGGTGLLGKYLIEGNHDNREIFATYIGDYEVSKGHNHGAFFVKGDVRNKDLYEKYFAEFKPTVVIHTAGIASPDFAEKNKSEAREINIGGTKQLIDLSHKHNCSFIYISSNGIYDGGSAPYSEKSIAKPINYYGELKLEGEKVVAGTKQKHAIVRPILMYGNNYPFERNNIITFALSKLKKGEKVFAYDEVYSNPLYARNCAQAIWKIIREDKYDDYNIAGNERVSIFQLIKKAAEVFNYDQSLVHPVKQGYFNELVKRPKDTSYITKKMAEVLKIEPLSIEVGLKMMKEESRS